MGPFEYDQQEHVIRQFGPHSPDDGHNLVGVLSRGVAQDNGSAIHATIKSGSCQTGSGTRQVAPLDRCQEAPRTSL
jgi:hypothetical protein